MPPKQRSLEQMGGGYQLCPSIKTTPKAKLAQGSDDKGAQMMAIRRSNNPEYVPLPKVNFIEGGVLTGWEDVTPDEVLCYNLASDGASSSQLDWQVYENYFKLNKEMEQEQHRDEDGNKVDYVHDNNFEAFVILVGKCVNDDGDLGVSYASPGLLEV
ncbi:hypothetical protein H0H87_010498 [Tephrocybe sp. NHM501043]|nr:hypothetical protein H0H87_010498 [Tephrocybe sp. NHM501043]